MTTLKEFSMDPEIFRTLALGTAILGGKMIVCNFLPVLPKALTGGNPPEDSWIYKGALAVPEQSFGSAKKDDKVSDRKHHEQTRRAERIIANDQENIPIGLMLFWTAAMSSTENAKEAAFLMKVFVGARFLHTGLYLGGVTGLSTLAFATGMLCIVRAMWLIATTDIQA